MGCRCDARVLLVLMLVLVLWLRPGSGMPRRTRNRLNHPRYLRSVPRPLASSNSHHNATMTIASLSAPQLPACSSIPHDSRVRQWCLRSRCSRAEQDGAAFDATEHACDSAIHSGDCLSSRNYISRVEQKKSPIARSMVPARRVRSRASPCTKPFLTQFISPHSL